MYIYLYKSNMNYNIKQKNLHNQKSDQFLSCIYEQDYCCIC